MGKYRVLESLMDRVFRNNLNSNFDDIDTDIKAANTRIDNLSIDLAEKRADVVDYYGGVMVDADSVYFSAGVNSTVFFLNAGSYRTLNGAAAAIKVTLDPSITNGVVQYLVVTAAQTVTFKRYNLLASDDWVIGIGLNQRITIFYHQDNGNYKTVEVLNQFNDFSYEPKSRILTVVKGAGMIYGQKNYTTPEFYFFTHTPTANAEYILFDLKDKILKKVSFTSAEILSPRYAVVAYMFREMVFVYGMGYLRKGYFGTQHRTNNAQDLIQQTIYNPFVKTEGDLIGDSITAGVGGTGYNASSALGGGEIFTATDGVTYYRNNTTSINWANMLMNYLNGFNVEKYVGPLDKHFKYSNRTIAGYYASSKSYVSVLFDSGEQVGFTFYGTEIKINFHKTTNTGIFNVKIDGVDKGNVDTYSSTIVWNNEMLYSGLSLGYHTVLVTATGTKNTSSGGTAVYFNGVTVRKHITFRNIGISNKDSKFLYDNINNYVRDSLDFIFLMMGTNDRKLTNEPEVINTYQRAFIELVLSKNIDIILMTAPPATATDEANSSRLFTMKEVALQNQKLSAEYNLPYISNYNEFLRYEAYTGQPFGDLLGDGLHPTDQGYKFMFYHICKKCGLVPNIS